MSLPSRSLLIESFDYEPSSGEFRWKCRPESHFKDCRAWKIWTTKFAGKKTGTIAPDGYVRLAIGNRTYMAHRIAFLIVHGYEPDLIDHINGVRSDNRIGNLRIATPTQNNLNCLGPRSNNKLGLRGVFLHKQTGKYRARLKIEGRIIELGLHETADQAAESVRSAMATHFGEFSNGIVQRGEPCHYL